GTRSRRGDGFIALEASVPWDKPDNPDIAEYTGYGRLELYWRPARGARWPVPGRHGALAVRIPWGARTFFPSVEATWAFGLGEWGEGWLAPRLAVQYFEGFAQNLLDYRERSSSWRIGLVFGE
ncbi:MAG: hypothetical protein HKN12_07380, partial [Gemmatimonadetes bacterium]|nr:hypothetical protein [Gemmatimonadota bacterium]